MTKAHACPMIAEKARWLVFLAKKASPKHWRGREGGEESQTSVPQRIETSRPTHVEHEEDLVGDGEELNVESGETETLENEGEVGGGGSSGHHSRKGEEVD